jgi:membrane protease YdiL (CAAX protease family)
MGAMLMFQPLPDKSMTDAENGNAAAEVLEPPNRKIQSIEVAVFLSLILPSMVLSFLTAKETDLRFLEVAIGSILNDLALLSLVLYFMWRNQERIEQIGWNFDHLRRDIAWGLILFVPVVLGGNLLQNVLHQAGFSAPSRMPSFLVMSGAFKVILGFIIVTVVAVVEETIFRGYLMLRLTAVTGRTSAAVLLSSLVFSLGHGYEGMAGALSIFVLGVVFAVIYLWRKSLVAPIVIHFFTDFTSIVLPALLSR